MKGRENRFFLDAPRGAAPASGGVRSSSVNGWLQDRLPNWPEIWTACARRTHAWRIPPRWSRQDWWDEIDAESVAGACHALRVFDPSRGPSINCFVYHQILASALARYRQEWTYARRFGISSAADVSLTADDDGVASDQEDERLRRSMTGLAEADRRLVEGLFWEGWTETEVANRLGISKQAVNKRKWKILLQMRRFLKKKDET
jgi:DNA-directed RNA polymerase specialized sigma24 family protein